jgi:predicted AlkP superfamily pyrophosphatase or phosphodiesterase
MRWTAPLPLHAALLVSSLGACEPAAVVGDGVTPARLDDTAVAPSPYADDPYALTESVVVLVSLDGFRWDYLDRAETPTLDRLVAEGAHAEALVPAFPTKTFPNHYTLATGLWPENHGIVDNSFYAPDLRETFDMFDSRDNQDPRWWGGEPIWITAERQGVTAGTMFWVGSEVQWTHGISATYAVPYDGSIPFSDRVERVLYWLDQPTDAPRLVTLYFNEPDHSAHSYGPDHDYVTEAIEQVDAVLAELVAGLEARGQLDTTDLVVVSDHGMTALSDDRLIVVDEHLDLDRVWVHSWGPWMSIWPMEASETDAIVAGLQALPHALCAARADLPPELHFSVGRRVAPVHCIADVGWTLTSADWGAGSFRGTHGYSPADADMHGLFVARGPHILPGARLPATDNVHVYSLLARLLEIRPATNDGELAPFGAALRPR